VYGFDGHCVGIMMQQFVEWGRNEVKKLRDESNESEQAKEYINVKL
jgi:hypothetical protein